jgi:hypothetical protein
LKQPKYSVVLEVRWFVAGRVPADPSDGGDPVSVAQIDLPGGVLPGESVHLSVPLTARSDGLGSLVRGPLPPGRYQVRLTLAQDQAPGFLDQGLVLGVTVRG